MSEVSQGLGNNQMNDHHLPCEVRKVTSKSGIRIISFTLHLLHMYQHPWGDQVYKASQVRILLHCNPTYTLNAPIAHSILPACLHTAA